MASIRERRRSDGTRSWAVLRRDPDTGRQTSLTYDDERDARVAKELIGAAGGPADEAARIAEAVRKPGPTVLEATTENIDMLTGFGADTRSHYRGQIDAVASAVYGDGQDGIYRRLSPIAHANGAGPAMLIDPRDTVHAPGGVKSRYGLDGAAWSARVVQPPAAITAFTPREFVA